MKTILTIILLLTPLFSRAQSVPQVIIEYPQGDLHFTFGKDKLSDLINGIQTLNNIPSSIKTNNEIIAQFQLKGDSINYWSRSQPHKKQYISTQQFWPIAISTILGIIADGMIKQPDTINLREATNEFFQIAEIYNYNCLYRPK